MSDAENLVLIAPKAAIGANNALLEATAAAFEAKKAADRAEAKDNADATAALKEA